MLFRYALNGLISDGLRTHKCIPQNDFGQSQRDSLCGSYLLLLLRHIGKALVEQ